jgi:hypothetical protein
MVHPNGAVNNGEEAQALRSDWLHSLPVVGRLTSYSDL